MKLKIEINRENQQNKHCIHFFKLSFSGFQDCIRKQKIAKEEAKNKEGYREV